VLFALNFLDDTDGNSLLHVTDSESTERGVLGEDFDDHRFLGDEFNHSGITGLNVVGLFFHNLTGTFVDLGTDLGELTGDMGGVAIEDGGISVSDLTGVVHDDNLGAEHSGISAGVFLGVRADISSLDVSDGQVLDVETNIVTGSGLIDGLVMHLDGFDLSGDVHGAESGNDTLLEDTGLNATDGYCTDTGNLVDILEGESESLVGGSVGGVKGIEGFEEVGSLVPSHVGGLLNHVITAPSGNGDEFNLGGVIADLLEVGGELVLDFLVSLLGVLNGVHLVDGDNHLSDSHSLGEESVLTSLSVLGETGLELSLSGSDHEDGGISLRSTSDHVLDEISVAGSIDDGEDSLGGLEFPESDIDGDTTLTLGLQFVEDPGVFERSFTHLVGFLLELGNSSLIDTTALVNKMTGGGGFAGIDMTDNDEVNSILFFSHVVVGVFLGII